MKNLRIRLISSAALLGLVVAALFWLPLWVYALVVSLFILGGLYEFFTMVRQRGVLVHRILSICLGVIYIGLVAWRSLVEPGLMPAFVLGPESTLLSWMWDIFWPATIVIIFIRQLTRENTFEALNGVATTLFGLAYVAALFSYLFYIRASNPTQGPWLVCFLILVTKMGDVGAYIVGRTLGRYALVPRISPRKTVEGFVGGIVLSGLTSVVVAPMLGWEITIFWAMMLGLFLGLCGQLGDLAESMIKRDCQVKDSGVMLPGLGGILDIIDSLLFTTPMFYAILIYG